MKQGLLVLSFLALSLQASAAQLTCAGTSDNFFGERFSTQVTANFDSGTHMQAVRILVKNSVGNTEKIEAKDIAGDATKYKTTILFADKGLKLSKKNCDYTLEFVKNASPARGKLNARCDGSFAAIYFKCQ